MGRAACARHSAWSVYEVADCCARRYMVMLPGKAKDGSLVSIFKLKDTNPRVYSFTSAIKTWCSLMEAHTARHGSEEGLICVLDVKGVSFGHLAVNLTVMAKFFVYFQVRRFGQIQVVTVTHATLWLTSQGICFAR